MAPVKASSSRQAADATRLRVADAILDGEVVCGDETGRPIFIEMLRGRHPVCFGAFDLLWLNGNDCARYRSSSGRSGSSPYYGGAPIISSLRRCPSMGAERRSWRHDLEGIVAKRKSDPLAEAIVGSTCRRSVRRSDYAFGRTANGSEG